MYGQPKDGFLIKNNLQDSLAQEGWRGNSARIYMVTSIAGDLVEERFFLYLRKNAANEWVVLFKGD